LNRLFDLSLLLDLDLGQRFFRLHDTTRHFLRDRSGKGDLVTQHKQLVVALYARTGSDADARVRRYYYLYLPHHLAEAQKRGRLDGVLLAPRWLQAKLAATADPQALVADYQQYGVGEAQSLIGRTLRLIAGILARDSRQLLPQLIGRLEDLETVAATGFLEDARQLVPRPAIVPIRPSLTPPGAETARLEGHGGWVMALCLLPDGRLASGSKDDTIRLWDVATGAETARLEGHNNSVIALCLLADGRLASGSWDRTIRLWDVATGAETARLEGHLEEYDDSFTALCLLADERLASGSMYPTTIRLWDVTTGAVTARLKGHGGPVLALCLLADGRLASGYSDSTIRLWDVATGAETARFWEYTPYVGALCLLADGRLAEGSADGTIRLWDVATGDVTARLKGHADTVDALCLLADGRLASGSEEAQTLSGAASKSPKPDGVNLPRLPPPRRARRH